MITAIAHDDVIEVPALRPSPDTAAITSRRGPVLLAMRGEATELATAALAATIAERQRLGLHVVTVLDDSSMGESQPSASPAVNGGDGAMRRSARAAVRDVLATVLGEGRPYTLEVRTGRVEHTIAHVAQEIDATAIVVGAAPHWRLRHAISGLRAAQILQLAGAPVFSVAPGGPALPRRVLAAIDFSPASITAARAALMIADDCASITLVHVAKPYHLAQPYWDPMVAVPTGDIAAVLGHLRDELQSCAPPGATIDIRVVSGTACRELLLCGDELDADLIAVGTHGPGLVGRLLLGSVASSILHLSTTHVLASRAPAPVRSGRQSPVTYRVRGW